MAEIEFPFNPKHKQVFTDNLGGRYIFSAKTRKWYTYTDENEKQLSNKKNWKLIITVIIVVISLVVFWSSEQAERKAKEAGFDLYSDYSEAQSIGITDPKEWTVYKENQKQTALEAKNRELDIASRSAGFEDVQTYLKAKEKNINSFREWKNHLYLEKFYSSSDELIGFVNLVDKSRDDFNSLSNDLAKGGTRNARGRGICKRLNRNLVVNSWVGKIANLSSNSDGWGVLKIEVAKGIYIKTWNNKISDVFHKTLINPNSRIFKILSNLREGDKIKFSGRFFRDRDQGGVDCINESSLTLSGSMDEPEFIFRFREIHLPETD